MMTPSATATMTVPFTVPRTVSTILLASRSPGSPISRSAVSSTRLPNHAPFCRTTNRQISAMQNRNSRCSAWPPNVRAHAASDGFSRLPPNNSLALLRIAQVGGPPAHAVLAERHLRQPLRHGDPILPDVRKRLDQRLTFQCSLVDRQPDRQEQHQPDDDRKRQRRQDIRPSAGDACGKFPIDRPDRQGDDHGPAERSQEIQRHPEGKEEKSDGQRDTRHGP